MNLDLLKHIKRFGSAYNTEDSSLFFYALTKMKHYKRFVEFGTGLGCTSLAVASAMKENGVGKCITFDNGNEYEGQSYSQFITDMVKKLEIQEHFILSQQPIDFHLTDSLVDCVFADFDRSVDTIEKLIEWAMFSMNNYSSIFIDGLNNYPEGYYYTKLLIKALNENKPPNFLLENKKFIEEHNFSLTTIRKQDKNNTGQGGMCWIKIEPNTLR
ncbi:MAG: hypothetical protein CMA31_02615 [Euryarchaeota archaeon]|nr:hypothetical protein [Euryarchaeota archaeon]|tara:strand:- start:76 stop:717 length:642 start_codon:yes stop_codon:yes gene_type:complete